MKSALFVDFDNIYLGLQRVDREAAERFATDPQRWLTWFEEGLDGGNDETRERRSLLVRKCYLNPKAFHAYRPYFTRSAFDVVDCPPLTRQGKNSGDIRMVMDILDALEHRTRFEEFVILSGDADFSPVLMRLRAHDRRTTVLAIGFAAEAYKAAADAALSETMFVEEALGVRARPTRVSVPPSAPQADEATLRVAERIVVEVRARGTLLPAEVVRVLQGLPDFVGSNWFGHLSLRALVAAVTRKRPELEVVNDGSDTSWCITMAGGAPPAPAQATTPSAVPTLEQVLDVVRNLAATSPGPVPLARAAQAVLRDLGAAVIDSNWVGMGTFKNCLQHSSASDLMVESDGPGYVLLAAQRPTSDVPSADTLERRVSRVTGTPALETRQYAILFATLSEELAANEFQLQGTSKAVRDYLTSQGEAVSRAAITFVLRGLLYNGLPLHEAPRAFEAAELAHAFYDNVLVLCEFADLTLDDDERARLRGWICG